MLKEVWIKVEGQKEEKEEEEDVDVGGGIHSLVYYYLYEPTTELVLSLCCVCVTLIDVAHLRLEPDDLKSIGNSLVLHWAVRTSNLRPGNKSWLLLVDGNKRLMSAATPHSA